MSISRKELYEKLQELDPSLRENIKPEMLNSLCEDEEVQVFLKWFCDNISRHNILTEEEMQFAKYLQESGCWLQGDELNSQLEEATRNNPELLNLLDPDIHDTDSPTIEYINEKESYCDELNYFNFLENQIKKLKQIENKLDDELEQVNTTLEREHVDMQKEYKLCFEALQHFDLCCRDFSERLKQLLNVYADSISKNGDPCIWTQMPLDLFIKEIESYSMYLEMYLKKQELNIKVQFEDAYNSDSEHSLSMNNEDDVLQELFFCKKNLAESKHKEIYSKAEEAAWQSNVEFVKYLYNDGININVPQNQAQLRSDIIELKRKRDFAEESVEALSNQQLDDVTTRFAELEITKIEKENAQLRVERRKSRLAKLENLRFLAKQHGHALSDLLCMLMQHQQRLFSELNMFVTDALHYLASEYTFSEERCKSMQQLQDEYNKILTSYTNEQNVFNRLFISMMGNDDNSDIESAIQEFELLVADNKRKTEALQETECYAKLKNIQSIEKSFSTVYNAEVDNGLTMSFKALESALKSKLEDTIKKMELCESSITTVRNKYKEILKQFSDCTLEREKSTLWQMFLVAPDALISKYEELSATANEISFKNSL